MNIKIDDLSGIQIVELLKVHMAGMVENTPVGSVHALDIEGLRKSEITFWSAWEGDELLGCGALKELDKHHAELKSMRTATQHLRKGVASQILKHIIEQARSRGYLRLSLETSVGDSFKPARYLYNRFGFEYCDPFADYLDDPNSVFMTMDLSALSSV